MKGIIFKQIVHLISSTVQWLVITRWKDARFHSDVAMPLQKQNNRRPVGRINQLINAQGREGNVKIEMLKIQLAIRILSEIHDK